MALATLPALMETRIWDALDKVYDPELGMSVVELALIRSIELRPTSAEVKMVLTSPWCPYAGVLTAEIEKAVSDVTETPVKVTILAERWDPAEAGLSW